MKNGHSGTKAELGFPGTTEPFLKEHGGLINTGETPCSLKERINERRNTRNGVSGSAAGQFNEIKHPIATFFSLSIEAIRLGQSGGNNNFIRKGEERFGFIT